MTAQRPGLVRARLADGQVSSSRASSSTRCALTCDNLAYPLVKEPSIPSTRPRGGFPGARPLRAAGPWPEQVRRQDAAVRSGGKSVPSVSKLSSSPESSRAYLVATSFLFVVTRWPSCNPCPLELIGGNPLVYSLTPRRQPHPPERIGTWGKLPIPARRRRSESVSACGNSRPKPCGAPARHGTWTSRARGQTSLSEIIL